MKWLIASVLAIVFCAANAEEDPKITQRLAEAIVAFDYDDIPPDVVRYAKQLMADNIAVAVGAHHVETTDLLQDIYEVNGGDHLILHSGKRGKMMEAIYLNSLAANMLDFDDGHVEVGHPGITAIQPALVLMKQYGKSEKELIEAVVAGYEFNIRWARAVFSYPDKFAGPWGSATLQVMGTTVTAAKLLDLNVEQIQRALFFAAGNTPLPFYQKVGLHPGQTMSGLKNNYGQVSQAGVLAVLTALAGIPAETTVLDGDQGQWRMMASQAFDSEVLFAALGERWETLDVLIKPYAACRWMHSSIDAFSSALEGVDAADIERIDVHLFRIGANALAGVDPQNLLDLQFSMPTIFGLLAGGHDLIDLRMRDARLPAAQSLSDKVHVHFSEHYESLFRQLKLPAKAVITLKDGTKVEHEVLDARGARSNPLADEEHVRKVRTLIDSSPHRNVRRYARRFLPWAGTS